MAITGIGELLLHMLYVTPSPNYRSIYTIVSSNMV